MYVIIELDDLFEKGAQSKFKRKNKKVVRCNVTDFLSAASTFYMTYKRQKRNFNYSGVTTSNTCMWLIFLKNILKLNPKEMAILKWRNYSFAYQNKIIRDNPLHGQKRCN